MFSSPTPQELLMRKLEQLELNVAESNINIVEVRKALLQQQSLLASMLGDTAKVVVASNDSIMAHHSNSVEMLKAQSANKVLRSINREGHRLEPLQKEFPSGDEADGGVRLANSVRPDNIQDWQSWPPIARPLVGETPPGDLFPGSFKALETLDHLAILQLIAFYNDGFGIRREDSLDIRQDKFRRWCCS